MLCIFFARRFWNNWYRWYPSLFRFAFVIFFLLLPLFNLLVFIFILSDSHSLCWHFDSVACFSPPLAFHFQSCLFYTIIFEIAVWAEHTVGLSHNNTLLKAVCVLYCNINYRWKYQLRIGGYQSNVMINLKLHVLNIRQIHKWTEEIYVFDFNWGDKKYMDVCYRMVKLRYKHCSNWKCRQALFMWCGYFKCFSFVSRDHSTQSQFWHSFNFHIKVSWTIWIRLFYFYW